jgi:hypothetical protein
MKIKNLTLSLILGTAVLASCSKDNEPTPTPQEKPLRAAIDYSKLTADTKYDASNTLFVDASGKSTVDLTAGNIRFRMFQGINTYAGTWKTQTLDVNVLKNLYANASSPFSVLTNPTGVDLTALNASGLQLRNVTASSLSATDAEAVRAKIESHFASLASISPSKDIPALKGTAGFVIAVNPVTLAESKYLVDAKGLETGQLIQKGLIGAFDLDYIGNVLLGKGLDADNKTVITGKNYTKLEQNWDEAYGALTVYPIMYVGYTATDNKGATNKEAFLGSYLWEYNRTEYANIHPAFLKGRAAIANNDIAEVKKQGLFIRNAMEKAIAKAALGYLDKWRTGLDVGARAHAIGEGYGFIYSLRFATLNGGNAKFSDDILTALVGSEGGFWDLNIDKIVSAETAIKAKFGL